MNSIRKPKLIKRFAALVVDIMLWFLVSLMALSFVINPCVNSITNYEYKTNEYRKGMYEIGAYVYVEYKTTSDSYYYEIIGDVTNTSYENLTYNEENTLGITMITTSNLKITVEQLDYYVAMLYTNIGDIDSFNASKVDSELFDESGLHLESAKEEDLKNYYFDQYQKVFESEKFKNYKDGYIYNLGDELNTIDIIKAYSSYFVSLVIFYLLIPMLSKKRQTLGKRILNLEVIDAKTSQNASKMQILIRFAAITLIEFFLSMILSGLLYLPLLVSIIMMVITLNQSTIHDYISGTRVIEVVDNVYMNEEAVNKDFIDASFKEVESEENN